MAAVTQSHFTYRQSPMKIKIAGIANFQSPIKRCGILLTSHSVSNNLPLVNTYCDLQLDALGDSTRRAILDRLLDTGPLAVVDLAYDFTVSRPAISQHLKILKDASLVVDRAEGNRRVYAINPEGFAPLRDYFDQFWNQALYAFKKKVEGRSAKGRRR